MDISRTNQKHSLLKWIALLGLMKLVAGVLSWGGSLPGILTFIRTEATALLSDAALSGLDFSADGLLYILYGIFALWLAGIALTIRGKLQKTGLILLSGLTLLDSFCFLARCFSGEPLLQMILGIVFNVAFFGLIVFAFIRGLHPAASADLLTPGYKWLRGIVLLKVIATLLVLFIPVPSTLMFLSGITVPYIFSRFWGDIDFTVAIIELIILPIAAILWPLCCAMIWGGIGKRFACGAICILALVDAFFFFASYLAGMFGMVKLLGAAGDIALGILAAYEFRTLFHQKRLGSNKDFPTEHALG